MVHSQDGHHIAVVTMFHLEFYLSFLGTHISKICRDHRLWIVNITSELKNEKEKRKCSMFTIYFLNSIYIFMTLKFNLVFSLYFYDTYICKTFTFKQTPIWRLTLEQSTFGLALWKCATHCNKSLTWIV